MITTCTECGTLYEAGSEEQANEATRRCARCQQRERLTALLESSHSLAEKALRIAQSMGQRETDIAYPAEKATRDAVELMLAARIGGES